VDEAKGISERVYKWLDYYNIKRRDSGPQTDGDTEKLRDAEWLREQYLDERRSAREIADGLNLEESTVLNWLKRHNIQTLSNSERQIESDALDRLKDRDWMYTEYITKERPSSEIGAEIGVSEGTVRNWLREHDIKIRSLSEALTDGDVQKLRDNEWLREQYQQKEKTSREIATELGLSKGPVLRALREHGIDTRPGHTRTDGNSEKLRDKEWLEQQYHDERRTSVEIANELNVAKGTVLGWLGKHGISRRDRRAAQTDGDIETLYDEEWLREQYEEKQKTSIEIAAELELSKAAVLRALREYDVDRRRAAPYKGGGSITRYYAIRKFISEEPWTDITTRHRQKNPECKLCGIQNDLHTHHIIPITAGGTNESWNLITLCSSCHPTVEWYTSEYIEHYM
jgi:transposase